MGEVHAIHASKLPDELMESKCRARLDVVAGTCEGNHWAGTEPFQCYTSQGPYANARGLVRDDPVVIEGEN